MILTGQEIIKRRDIGQIVIDPWNVDQVNPNSYNVTLHPKMEIYSRSILSTVEGESPIFKGYLDSKSKNETIPITIPENGLKLLPGTVYIARTNEHTETHGLVPMLNGRSSLGRLGLFIHVTAGFGDIGFKGTWTLEIVVVEPLMIYPNIKIGQIYYQETVGEHIGFEYSGKYQGQVDATASRLFTEM